MSRDITYFRPVTFIILQIPCLLISCFKINKHGIRLRKKSLLGKDHCHNTYVLFTGKTTYNTFFVTQS